ncbi:MAG: hypothetical protein WBH98_04605 [Bacteroidales bacterium]
MKTKLIIMTLSLSSLFGCANAQKTELISADYHRSGMRSDDRISIRVKKITETYTVEFEKGHSEETNSTSFEITQNDFDKLANILFGMSKPRKERRNFIRDLMEHLDVKFIKNGKVVSYNYSINQPMDEKTAELQNQAIDLMYLWIDKYKQRSEIRIYYSKGIATPTEIYTHADPADLVEDLGTFTERLDPNRDNYCGGSNDYSHRWRALKPGVVTVWFEELMGGYDASRMTEEFEPHSCYIIDENLNVRYSKEETETAREKFKQRTKR